MPDPRSFSMLSFALVYAGSFDGRRFVRPDRHDRSIDLELRPISEDFQAQPLAVNGLDRGRLSREGAKPKEAMDSAHAWVREIAGGDDPALVAYPLSFDWSWLHWYVVAFAEKGSPFGFSRCFDVKTAYAVKAQAPISAAGRANFPERLSSRRPHTHNALDDAIERAEIFENLFSWGGEHGGDCGRSRQSAHSIE